MVVPRGFSIQSGNFADRTRLTGRLVLLPLCVYWSRAAFIGGFALTAKKCLAIIRPRKALNLQEQNTNTSVSGPRLLAVTPAAFVTNPSGVNRPTRFFRPRKVKPPLSGGNIPCYPMFAQASPGTSHGISNGVRGGTGPGCPAENPVRSCRLPLLFRPLLT
jgi:hypothetical protein